MRTESRFEQYDLDIVLPAPLVPRNERFVIDERIGADGSVLKALDLAEVDALCDSSSPQATTASPSASSIPISMGRMKRSFAIGCWPRKPAFPSRSRRKCRRRCGNSSASTLSAPNAFVKPLMASYLNRLVGRLTEEGTRCPVFMIHSGGGIISVESAIEFPVRLLESGPAGGAIFAAHIASSYGLDRVLSYDMGGTTAKICLIEKQTPKTSKTFEVARTWRFKKGSGMPISIPVIEMVEIGAGGGSIATIDSMRQIRVGPHSAGSEPGPAATAAAAHIPPSPMPT